MVQELGIEKAAIGIRHLIDYIETGNIEDLESIKDCIFEVKLWTLITFFSNQIDELSDYIPDFILDSIFLSKPLEIVEGEEVSQDRIMKLYGRGYKSNSDASFKDQFRIIRGSMSHCHFTYDDGMIHIFNKNGFEADFDIIWLQKLINTVLTNKKLGLVKGMSDASILSLVNNEDCSLEELKSYFESGLISTYKITSLTSNKETIANALNIPSISSDIVTFELIFQSAISMMRQNHLVLGSRQDILKQMNFFFRDIENFFGNKIKLELLPFELDDSIIQDELFGNLSFKEKLQYVLRKSKCNDLMMYNSMMTFYLLDLLGEIEKGEYKSITLLSIKDAYDYLLKVYASVYFAGYKQGDVVYSQELISSFGGEARYVHAKNIYKEYLRVINRALEEFKTYHYPKRGYKIDLVKEFKTYTRLLDEAINEDAYTDLGWKVRNSIIHNHIDFIGDTFRFYTTGRNIVVKHYNKKNNSWIDKEFINKRPIWEMTINKYSLLQLIDTLFQDRGVDTKSSLRKNGQVRVKKKPNN